ncbi:MAG: amidohydrolase family protein [Asgard group archaeon]|nr:amidohydrolase family protein [Asgard group archaeon]
MTDIVITNTNLLTFLNDNLGIIDDGLIAVEDGLISFIGKSKDFDYKSADTIIDGSNHITMPGLINCHIHSSLTLLRGGAQDLPEIEWMNKGLGPLTKHLTVEDIILGSKLGVLEGLRSGTTTFAEYTSNVATLINETYLPYHTRVVATETINEVNANRAHLKPTDLYEFDEAKGEKAFKQARELFSKFNTNQLVTPMYGPQALDMISLELLHSIHEEAVNTNTNMHMHVAQGGRERLQIQGRFGDEASTVKILDREKLLDKNLIAAHCHDTTAQERETLVKRGAKIVGCPSSISMIDGIIPPVGHIVSIGGIIGLGSDQAPGPGTHNMFREMRTISLATKITMNDPTILPAWEVLQLATIKGAKALGLEQRIGSLEVGKEADIITINLKHLNLTPVVKKPFRNYIPNLVYSSTGFEVDNVIIRGKQILSNGQFLITDPQTIIDEANKNAERIFDAATNDWLEANSKMVEIMRKGFI